MADDLGLDAPALDDALLRSLQEARSGELGDIVATIQAAQYEIVSRDMRQLLVIQGAPGTGKTVIGLHRVSWLLYNIRDELEANDVLIVGPNPTFVRYISTVLPSLGDAAVVQQPVGALGPRVRQGRTDSPELRRLKGDMRMEALVRRGLRNRQRLDTGPITVSVAGRRVTIDGGALESRAAQLANAPHNQVYAELRDYCIRLVEAELHRGGVRDMAALELSARGPDSREIDNLLERIWPNLTPQAFLLDLFSTRRQLETAASGQLDEREIDLLTIPRDTRLGAWQWSHDDVAILDAADQLLNGTRQTYGYIVVDEAQDLSPMQLLSIARRSRTGWMTVLGDLAQGTSPWAPETWDSIASVLQRSDVPGRLEQLELAYRLPSEVHEVAMRLLPTIGPGLTVPRAVREQGTAISVTATTVDGLVDTVVERVRELLGTGLVGLIVPDEMRLAVTHALDIEDLTWSPELRSMAAPIVVLSPDEAKGLEFDNVVVVEPGQIVDGHERGLQALFVALTRCTRRLALVHAQPLPPELGLRSAVPPKTANGPGVDADVEVSHDRSGEIGAPANSTRSEPVDTVGAGAPSSNGIHAPADPRRVDEIAHDGGLASARAAEAVQREVARAVAGALMRYVTLTVQPEVLPLVIAEMQRWTTVQPAQPVPD